MRDVTSHNTPEKGPHVAPIDFLKRDLAALQESQLTGHVPLKDDPSSTSRTFLTIEGKQQAIGKGPEGCTIPYFVCPVFTWVTPADDRLYLMDKGALRFIVFRDVRILISKNASLATDLRPLRDKMCSLWRFKKHLETGEKADTSPKETAAT